MRDPIGMFMVAIVIGGAFGVLIGTVLIGALGLR
jgi:hypothetical protein